MQQAFTNSKGTCITAQKTFICSLPRFLNPPYPKTERQEKLPGGSHSMATTGTGLCHKAAAAWKKNSRPIITRSSQFPLESLGSEQEWGWNRGCGLAQTGLARTALLTSKCLVNLPLSRAELCKPLQTLWWGAPTAPPPKAIPVTRVFLLLFAFTALKIEITPRP